MIALVTAMFLLALLASLVSVIANVPGRVELIIAGYEITIAAATLLGAVLGAGVLVVLIALIVAWLVIALPHHWRYNQMVRRHGTSAQAMATALMALARGDGDGADRAARIACQKLPDQALPHLMAAQAALMRGASDEAERQYRTMVLSDKTDEQKALGLEGLFYLAHQHGDTHAAHAHALQVLELAPKTRWALDGLMALCVQAGDFAAAHGWLRRWAGSGVKRVGVKHEVKQRRAVIWLAEAQAQDHQTSTGRAAALRLAERAIALNGDLIPAIALAARLHGARGDLGRARRVLRAAWGRAPHVELAHAWVDCYAGQPASTRLRAVSTLTGKNADHLESHLLRARLALDARSWLLAARLLTPYADDNTPERRVYTLLAEAETGLGNLATAQNWHDKAARASPAAGWLAGLMRLDAWQPVCPVTGKLGGVTWGIIMSAPDIASAPLPAITNRDP